MSKARDELIALVEQMPEDEVVFWLVIVRLWVKHRPTDMGQWSQEIDILRATLYGTYGRLPEEGEILETIQITRLDAILGNR